MRRFFAWLATLMILMTAGISLAAPAANAATTNVGSLLVAYEPTYVGSTTKVTATNGYTVPVKVVVGFEVGVVDPGQSLSSTSPVGGATCNPYAPQLEAYVAALDATTNLEIASGTVTVVMVCAPTATASATGSTVTVKVTNPNTNPATDGAVTYTVTVAGQSKTVTVAGGNSGSVAISGVPAGTQTVKVTGSDGTSASVTVTTTPTTPAPTTPAPTTPAPTTPAPTTPAPTTPAPTTPAPKPPKPAPKPPKPAPKPVPAGATPVATPAHRGDDGSELPLAPGILALVALAAAGVRRIKA